jgi:integrase
MADIRKRKGKKGTTYQVRYPSKSAATGYAFATFATLKEARAFTENLGSLKDRAGSMSLRVPDAVDRWLDICEKIGRDGRETVEAMTLKDYQRRARIIKDYSWTKKLHELEPADIVQFRSWLLENKSRDLARRTLSGFHSILIEMKQQGFMRDDPAAGITVRSGGRSEDFDSEVEIPSDAEMRDILRAAETLRHKNKQMEKVWGRFKPMLYLAAFSGMRPSEYRGLPWANLEKDRVHVRQRADNAGVIGPVKSKAGRRTIYLPCMVADMIFEWRAACPAGGTGLVFPTAEGNPITLSNFRRFAWIPVLREAGLTFEEKVDGRSVERTKYTPYALRHYFASKLFEKGKDLKFIQQTMGHAQIELTLNVYGHLIKDREETHKQTAEELALELIAA